MNRRKIANYSIDMSKYILENQNFKHESFGHIKPDFKENESICSINDSYSTKKPCAVGGGMRFKNRTLRTSQDDYKKKGVAKNQIGKP